ncbi:MAG: DUF2252 family protein [Chthoniobacteraceae bacterium]
MDIVKATKQYEKWLARRLPLLEKDLQLKHQRMKEGAFPFLRATFYRWCQLWPEVCPKLTETTEVLAVGDLHVENFGTWCDAEGRLVWGINDFDEAAHLPFTLDLVRLTTSALLAAREGHLSIPAAEAAEAILTGYRQMLKTGGQPFVLGEHHTWLRELAISEQRDPAKFWEKLDSLRTSRGKVPGSARKALAKLLPAPPPTGRMTHRIAGLGSLGRERYTFIADWAGGKIAREAKRLTASAADWARGSDKRPGEILYNRLLEQSIRCPDPFVRLQGPWIIRRLAPNCSRIELSSLPRQRDERRLLLHMGQETANIHLGSPRAVKKIRRQLARLPVGWLETAAQAMADATLKDWRAWKRAG